MKTENPLRCHRAAVISGGAAGAGDWPTALLLAAMCAIGARELLWATGLVPHKRLVAYAMICGALVCLWSYLGCPAGWALRA